MPHKRRVVYLSPLLIILACVISVLLYGFSNSQAARIPASDFTAPAKQANDKTKAVAGDEYGKLPLSFIANAGQADSQVKFLSRGIGYNLFLTSTEAVLVLATPIEGGGTITEQSKASRRVKPASSQVLRMKLVGANPDPIVSGLEELPGKVNYLLGDDAGKWHTNVPTYSKVQYRSVYPGIDLLYYGNQRQLEYDFIVSQGTDPGVIELAFRGARKLTLNKQGDLVIKTSNGDVRLNKPISYQELNGRRIEVASRYVLKGAGRVGFKIGHYDRNRPLVIDPVLAYSTYLGGSSSDRGLSIAVDSSGSAFVTGQTFSSNFPANGSSQVIDGLTADVFVTKLNPAGSAAIYSTFIGGNNDDLGTGIALDAAGNAYITGATSSTNFPTVNALHATSRGFSDAFIAELNSTGSALIYSTYLGGGSSDSGNAIALDSNGNVYVAGHTSSRDFPVANAFQATKFGSNLFKSIDGAGTWNPSDTALMASYVNDLAFDPQNLSIIYAATDTGIFKSIDGGSNWFKVGSGQTPTPVNRLAVNPVNTSIIYATAGTSVYKSTDGGNNWVASNSGMPILNIQTIVIDPTTPTTLYVGGISSNSIYKSTDGAASWSSTGFLSGATFILSLAIDPTSSSTLYAGTNRGVYKSTNGGSTWSAINTGLPFQPTVRALVIDKNNPLTIYAAIGAAIYKTTNGGSNWVNISVPSNFTQINIVALDPTNSSVIYAITQTGRIYKSTDGGANWIWTGTGSSFATITAFLINPSNPSLIYLGTNGGTEAFVTKLSAGGLSQVYTTYLGGSGSEVGYGIAADASGNAYVVGGTNSSNFPVANALQPNKADTFTNDAFITKLNPTGSALTYSTYLGGDNNDVGRAIALDSSGNAYVTGSTTSSNFPLVGAMQDSPNFGIGSDAFVTKLNAAGSAHVYSTYLGGDGEDIGLGIAVDSSGSSFITGSTRSFDFPTVSAIQAAKSLSADVFVTKLSQSGATPIYSTYIGGGGLDEGYGIALDSVGNPYVVGLTGSSNFPTANPIQSTYGGNGDTFILKLRPAVDLSVTLTDSPDPVRLGDNLTYTIAVKNNGDLVATGVTLNDTLPAGSTFVSASSTLGTCSGTGPITCAIGTLNPGDSQTVTIIIKPPAVKTITNAVSVSSNEPDGNPANNSTTQDTQVTFADLSIVGTTAYNKVAPGSKVNYFFTVKNNSGSTAESLTLTDNLPSGVTFVSCSAQGGVCGGSGNNVTVTFSTLAVGQSALVVLVATVDNSVAEGTTLNNTATISSATPDPDPSNNSSTVAFNVTATPLRQKTNGKIAFSTGRIYTVKDDGSEAPTPFPNIPNASFPTWSPDGTKLAFLVMKFRPVYPNDSYAEINVANADGTGIVPIADNSIDLGFDRQSRFDWSPDGTRIAYVGKDRTIYIANTDGTGYSKLPNSPPQVKDLDWSPDGSRFLFSQMGVIYVMNVDGSGLTKLRDITTGTDGPADNLAPSWSPDMSKILFTQDSNNYSDVFIMNSDGTGAQRLFNAEQTSGGAWSPDGKKVAFYQFTEVHVMNIDGSGGIKLATGEGCCFHGAISWQPIPTNLPLEPPPPPAQTYSISGRVTSSNNGPSFFSMTLVLSGTRSATLTNLGEGGTYQFTNLPAGGNYTVTPTSTSVSFSPPSRTFNNLSADQTGADFVATYIPLNISGHVRDTNGNPLANVQVTSSGGFPQATTYTDANGYYIFPNVQRGRNYTISVQWWGAYTFEPQSQTLFNPTSSATVNFVGTKHPSHIISGRVTASDAPGVGVAGVPVNLARENHLATFVFTDANGNYTFGEQRAGFQYSVSIYDQPGYIYAPRIINVASLNADQQLNFVRYPFSGYAIISGKVLDAQGNPVVSALLTLSGAANMTTTTGNNGTYSFVNVPAGLNYTLTPSKAGYVFNPAQQPINNLNSNGHQADFTALLPQTIQLSQASYTVGEAGGNIAVVVTRTDSTAAANVDYATSDTFPISQNCQATGTGIASSRCDYATSIGTLRFASGEASKTIFIPIVDDNIADGNESFTITLSNAVGATIGGNSSASISITDNANTAGNPIDTVPFFVRQHYIDLLGREPDPAGNQGWQDILNGCGTTVAQPCDRIEVSSAFFRSDEFANRGYFIYRFYSAVGRIPLYEQFMPDFAKVSGFLSPEQLEANKVAFTNEFMARSEFQNLYGSLTDPTAYVNALTNTVGLPNHPGKPGWIQGLTNGSQTRAQVLRQLIESGEVYTKYYNEAFVIMQYFGYLRRSADISYLQWIQTMNSNGGDYRTMINGFLNSAEYRQRFGN